MLWKNIWQLSHYRWIIMQIYKGVKLKTCISHTDVQCKPNSILEQLLWEQKILRVGIIWCPSIKIAQLLNRKKTENNALACNVSIIISKPFPVILKVEYLFYAFRKQSSIWFLGEIFLICFQDHQCNFRMDSWIQMKSILLKSELHHKTLEHTMVFLYRNMVILLISCHTEELFFPQIRSQTPKKAFTLDWIQN